MEQKAASAAPVLATLDFPNPDSQRRFATLVGVDDVTQTLRKELAIGLNPAEFEKWLAAGGAPRALTAIMGKRSSLYLLAGDVGTGKTEIGETIGDSVARELGIPVTLFRMGLGMRGSGLVGEMSRLISSGFDEVMQAAKRWKVGGKARAAGVLFIDEADALAQSRELMQMHHEDRAGVNSLIRGIDDIGRADVPVAIVLATNRLEALDPAVRRRAARTFELGRPNEAQRRALFTKYLSGLSNLEPALPQLIAVTGPTADRPYGYTYSDIVMRLIPDAILAAYPTSSLSTTLLIAIAGAMQPTPPFKSATG